MQSLVSLPLLVCGCVPKLLSAGGFAGLYSAASRGRFTADCDPASACHCTDMHEIITKEIAADFEREHYVILKNVLSSDEVEAAHRDVSLLLADGTMRPNPQEEKWKNKRDDDIVRSIFQFC